MALYAAIRDQEGSHRYQMLARQGMVMRSADSALLAETLGLEWALGFILVRWGGGSHNKIVKA